MPRVMVEEVDDKRGLRRLLDLPDHLHRKEPAHVASVMSVEEARLDPHRNPFFDAGDAAYFMARDRGRPAGRVVAHDHPVHGAGWGFFDAADDPEVVAALVEAARRWLAERGFDGVEGPRSFTAADGAGIRVDGHDVPAATGVPWNPPRYADHLVAAGCEAVGDVGWHRWVLDDRPPGKPPTTRTDPDAEVPAGLAEWFDERLALRSGAGTVLAVPDVAGALAGVGFRSAWRAAKRAKQHDFEGAVVVSVDGDPASLVPAVVGAARAAGYRWLLAPWAPDDRAPTLVQRIFRLPT